MLVDPTKTETLKTSPSALTKTGEPIMEPDDQNFEPGEPFQSEAKLTAVASGRLSRNCGQITKESKVNHLQSLRAQIGHEQLESKKHKLNTRSMTKPRPRNTI